MSRVPQRAVVAIDNGLNGGGCILDGDNGEPLAIFRNPTKNFVIRNVSKSDTLKGMLDGVALHAMLAPLQQTTRVVVVGERPLLHAQSAAALRSMWHSFGVLEGLSLSFEWVPIDVKEWQRPMLGKIPKSKTKEKALAVAKTLAPHYSWVPQGCRTPHDGVVDAFLLGRFVLREKKIEF